MKLTNNNVKRELGTRHILLEETMAINRYIDSKLNADYSGIKSIKSDIEGIHSLLNLLHTSYGEARDVIQRRTKRKLHSSIYDARWIPPTISTEIRHLYKIKMDIYRYQQKYGKMLVEILSNKVDNLKNMMDTNDEKLKLINKFQSRSYLNRYKKSLKKRIYKLVNNSYISEDALILKMQSFLEKGIYLSEFQKIFEKYLSKNDSKTFAVYSVINEIKDFVLSEGFINIVKLKSNTPAPNPEIPSTE